MGSINKSQKAKSRGARAFQPQSGASPPCCFPKYLVLPTFRQAAAKVKLKVGGRSDTSEQVSDWSSGLPCS